MIYYLSYEVKYDQNAGLLFDVPSHEFQDNTVNNYFLNDMGNGQPYPFGVIDLTLKGDTSKSYDWAENFVYRVTPSISYYSSMYDHDNDESTDSAIIGESDYYIEYILE